MLENISTREELTANWYIGAILEAGVWKASHYVRGYLWYIGVEPDIDDFLMMGEWY
jgi:hypothetical protein